MFTPIRNFITYIQKKNAGGGSGAIFRTGPETTTTTTMETTTQTTATAKTINMLEETPTSSCAVNTKPMENNCTKQKPNENCPSNEHIIKVTLEDGNYMCSVNINNSITTTKAITTNATKMLNNRSNKNSLKLAAFNADDDDIELQIKSSIMVKPAAVSVEKAERSATPINNRERRMSILRRPSISGTGPSKSFKKSVHFTPPPGMGRFVPKENIIKTINRTKETIATSTIVAAIITTPKPVMQNVNEIVKIDTKNIAEELNDSFESALGEESFLEVSLPEIPNSEIIVLNCIDKQNGTSTPTEDPLELDETLNTTTTASEVATEEVSDYWLDAKHVHQQITTMSTLTPIIVSTINAQDVCDSDRLTNANNMHESNAVEEMRSEGSDSGLGTEAQISKVHEIQEQEPIVTAILPLQFTSISTTVARTQNSENCTVMVSTNSVKYTHNAIVGASSAAINFTTPYASTFASKLNCKPLRSNLKRRITTETAVSVDETCSTSCTDLQAVEQKRIKRCINFDSVKVYYFPRQQGFNCVPSAGGCTLGMGAQHIAFKTMSLAEHAAELRRAHRLQLQEINARGSSSDDSEESEEDFLSEGNDSDMDAETNGFLQPVTPKQRRALLKAAGVRKIDAAEKLECRDIRNSREVCGCSCRDFCDPETCSCNQAGIKCQVDRASFPCGCSRDACGNTVGRVEFNPARVRTHFIHTIMRLEMENRQQPHVVHMNNNNNSHNLLNGYDMSPSHYYSPAQTHSNYSSGYASPAYNTDSMGAAVTASQSPASYYGHPSHFVANNYQMDSLDYAHNATTTYTDIHTAATAPAYNSNYATAGNNSRPATPYNCYLPQTNHTYTPHSNHVPLLQQSAAPINNYNCHTPTLANYDCATSTPNTLSNVSGSYSNDEIVNDSGTTSFISLNTPVANATRLSQINDLLQHNRHTTATLVAVNASASSSNNYSGTLTTSTPNLTGLMARTVTPSPSPSPTSSTTISVELDETSNTTIAESGLITAEIMSENLNEPTHLHDNCTSFQTETNYEKSIPLMTVASAADSNEIIPATISTKDKNIEIVLQSNANNH